MNKVFHVVVLLIIISCAMVVLARLYGAEQNREAIVEEMNRLGYHAVLHVRAEKGLGGNGVFTAANGGKAYRLPKQLHVTENASYSVIEITDSFIVVKAVSRFPIVGEIVARIDCDGKVEVLGDG